MDNKKKKAGRPKGKRPAQKHKTGVGSYITTNRVTKTKITPKQRVMINQTINALIETRNNKKEAAKLLGISENAIHKRINAHPAIIREMNEVNEQVIELARQRVKSNAVESANAVIDIASKSKSDNTRLNANLELLDRAGITKPQQSNNIQVNVLNQMKKQADQYDL